MVAAGHTHLLPANHHLSGDALPAADDGHHTHPGLPGVHLFPKQSLPGAQVGHLFCLSISSIDFVFISQTLTYPCCVSVRYDAAIVGAVRLFSVAIAAFLMDKAGRKALLYTSSMLMFLSSLTLTMISHTTACPPGPTPPNITMSLDYSPHNAVGDSAAGLIPLISTMVFIFGECKKQLVLLEIHALPNHSFVFSHAGSVAVWRVVQSTTLDQAEISQQLLDECYFRYLRLAAR